MSIIVPILNLDAQNLESIGTSKPVIVSGGVSTNQVFYKAFNISQRRDPYLYVYTGSLNLNIYQVALPFTFTYSNQNRSFSQPFNQFGLNPTYKWISTHIGYSSMNFSQYSLNGHVFLGGGVELSPPGRFKLSAMYGRLRKAVKIDNEDTLETISNKLPMFKRMGYGVKAGYAHDGDYLDLILFHAEDSKNSLPFIPDSIGVLPEENLVLSVSGGKKIFNKLLITSELAGSALSRDSRAEELKTKKESVFNYTGGLFNPRASTSYYNAFKSAITYTEESYSVGLGYERIDPGYRTLGAYFFNNDFENFTINTTTRLFKDKVNLGLNIGLQKNLDKTKINSNKRTVGAVNVGIIPSQKLNMNLSYSNFQSVSKVQSRFLEINQLNQYDNCDTLQFYMQVSQSANIATNYSFEGKNSNRQMLSANFSFNSSDDTQAENKNSSFFYNSYLTYNYNVKKINFGINTSFNASWNIFPQGTSATVGPVLGINKGFSENKIKASGSFSYNQSYTNEILTGYIFNYRLTGNYMPWKRHNTNISIVLVNRNNKSGEVNSFTEFTATAGYNFNF